MRATSTRKGRGKWPKIPAAPLPAWMDAASCATPEKRGLPWTTDGAQVPFVLAELMAETCESCPVRLACAAFVTRANITGGWWAGLDRDPHPNADAEPFPRAMPIYARDGQLIDHQLVLFSLGDVAGVRPKLGGAA